MSREVEIDAIFRLIEKLNEMKEMGAAPKDIENLEDDIGNLQMNSIIGDLFDED
jgi:hypothetical protein